MATIDDDIPIPNKYPFSTMGVGQSFFAPNKKPRNPISSYGNKHFHPKKFTQRTMTENGVTGLRIWRVE